MSEERKLCDLCDGQAATLLCSECRKCYCDRCSKIIHEIPGKKHETEAIPQGVRINAVCPHHKTDLKLFCVNEVKLCCFECTSKKFHNHCKVVERSEIDKDNETFSAENVKKNFAEVLRHDDELSKKIRVVIEEIEKESKETKDRIEKTFREEHEKLKIEENKILKELEKVSQQYKETLENTLTRLKNARKYSDILSETNSKLQGHYSRLMELNIVSEMEKQRQIEEEQHKTKMIGLKFIWDGHKRNLSYSQYVFNGIPVPGDIKSSIINSNSFDLYWSCNKNELSEKEKERLKHIVAVKKSSDDEGWKVVYSGKKMSCTINHLEVNTEYDIRITCFIDNSKGEWSDVAKIKTRTQGELLINGDGKEKKYFY